MHPGTGRTRLLPALSIALAVYLIAVAMLPIAFPLAVLVVPFFGVPYLKAGFFVPDDSSLPSTWHAGPWSIATALFANILFAIAWVLIIVTHLFVSPILHIGMELRCASRVRKAVIAALDAPAESETRPAHAQRC